jgi:simple sugar transport system ATP-binding protein
VLIGAEETTDLTTREILGRKVSHVPEDRVGMGCIPEFSILENVLLRLDVAPFVKHGFLNLEEASRTTGRILSEYDVKGGKIGTPAAHLSGGNIQKLIVGREFYLNPSLLIANNPTRGLDIAATEFIRSRLLEGREVGRATVLVSADLDEILQLSDKIAVMYGGRIAGIVDPETTSIDQIGMMMIGGSSQHSAEGSAIMGSLGQIT